MLKRDDGDDDDGDDDDGDGCVRPGSPHPSVTILLRKAPQKLFQNTE